MEKHTDIEKSSLECKNIESFFESNEHDLEIQKKVKIKN